MQGHLIYATLCLRCTNMPRDERLPQVMCARLSSHGPTRLRLFRCLFRYFSTSARAFCFMTSLFWTIPQWSVTSPVHDGPSQYICVQPTLVDGADATRKQRCPWACQALLPSSNHDAALSSKAASHIISVYRIFCRTHAAQPVCARGSCRNRKP